MAAQHLEDALRLLRTEYLATPNLVLTPREAATLLNLDRTVAATLLQTLEDARFLELTSDGRFRRASDAKRVAAYEPVLRRRRAV